MYAYTVLILLLLSASQGLQVNRQCEPIRIELCQHLGYNMTRMPNLGGNELQHEAEYILKSFNPLIEYGCSAQLKLFLCSIYAPMCTEKVPNPIGPCRSLCENVKHLCFPVLEGFGFGWPDALNCSRFPRENNHEHMCMEGPSGGHVVKEEEVAISEEEAPVCGTGHVRLGRNCVALCNGEALFDSADKRLAEVWVTVWAVICLVFSVAAALTLCIGGGRVRIRPLINLAVCYCFVAAGWTIRIVAGRTAVGCRPGSDNEDEFVVIQDGSAVTNGKCTVIFLMIYYFGMAANAWWVALCIWWLSKAAFDWSTERMRNVATILHIFAWGIPAIQTTFVLLLNKIDSDELTGICYVGNRSLSSLLIFALLPQAFYLLIGVKILVIGCYKILTRPVILPSLTAPLTAPRRQQNAKDSDLLGALVCVYVIPMASILGCLLYEYNNRLFLSNFEANGSSKTKPQLSIFLLKHLMSLFVGVSSIFWLWSIKSFTAWRNLLARITPKQLQKLQSIKQNNQQQMAMQVRSSIGSRTNNRTISTTLSTTLSTGTGSRQSGRRVRQFSYPPHRRN